jgi:FkbM family methyltransferase
MITILEHTIEETIIDKNGWILDLGCVNFGFSLEMKKYCNNIICVDPNPTIKHIPDGVFYEKAALVWDDKKEVEYFIYNDTNGYSLLNPSKDWCQLQDKIVIKSINFKDIMEKYNIEKFELIKFDIEGSEYEILQNMDWSISKQFSVEFHDFRFMNPHYPNNNKYYENLFDKIGDKFNLIKHDLTDHPGFPVGQGLNYWDSLFVEKN